MFGGLFEFVVPEEPQALLLASFRGLEMDVYSTWDLLCL